MKAFRALASRASYGIQRMFRQTGVSNFFSFYRDSSFPQTLVPNPLKSPIESHLSKSTLSIEIS